MSLTINDSAICYLMDQQECFRQETFLNAVEPVCVFVLEFHEEKHVFESSKKLWIFKNGREKEGKK